MQVQYQLLESCYSKHFFVLNVTIREQYHCYGNTMAWAQLINCSRIGIHAEKIFFLQTKVGKKNAITILYF